MKIWDGKAKFSYVLPTVYFSKKNSKLDYFYYSVLDEMAIPLYFISAMHTASEKHKSFSVVMKIIKM